MTDNLVATGLSCGSMMYLVLETDAIQETSVFWTNTDQ